MRRCKSCGIEKPLNAYTHYTKYPNKFRFICKECENKRARDKGSLFREEINRLNEEQDEIIREFNLLKSSEKILELLVDGYDISWSGNDVITFFKSEKVIHCKNATKEIYNLVFARYCIILETKFLDKNIIKYRKKNA